MLKALGQKTIICIPACCITILHGIYPKTPILATTVNTTFASTASTASGLAAGLKATGREDWNVLAVAGDGGTFDMGIQSLSGAAERGDNFIYVCYEQRSLHEYWRSALQRNSGGGLDHYDANSAQKATQERLHADNGCPRHSLPCYCFVLLSRVTFTISS